VAARARQRNGVPAIEWVTGGVGLFVVLGTLSFIGYESCRSNADGPDLAVEIEASHAQPEGFSATVIVRNTSRRAAAEVLIEGVARAKDGSPQRSEVRLDYVAGFSQRRATLVFERSPAEGGVAVRIVGYTTP